MHKRIAALAASLLAATLVGGCAAVPAATAIAAGSAGIAAASLGLSAYHDCRQDGGCKKVPLPR